MKRPELATPAIVLRSSAFGEADLMLTMLTPMHGRLELRANGARRSRRRFPGGLPIGARGNATLADRPSRSGVMRLLRFEPRADSAAIGRSLEAFAYTTYLCEISDRLITGASPDPTLFLALHEALGEALRRPAPGLLRGYELRLLDALGLMPALELCCVCGGPVAQGGEGLGDVAFDLERGGALCVEHAAQRWGDGTPGGGSESLSLAALDAARGLTAGSLAGAGEAVSRLEPADRRALRDLLLRVLRPHLRRPLRSVALFAQIGAMGRGSPSPGAGELPGGDETP